MQLLFGVIGPDDRAASVFDTLRAATQASNPGLDLTVERAPGLQVGRHLRSFGRWDGAGGEHTVLLDGEVRRLDGRDTQDRGTRERDLAELAQLHERHGTGIWSRLEGNFALLLREHDRFRLGLDVGGTRALYWWSQDGLLAFHTRLLDLVAAYPGDLAIDPAGVASYLAHGFYPLNATAFAGIGFLGGGQYLDVQPTAEGWAATLHDHFRLTPTDPYRASLDVLADELNDLLEPAIARSWRASARPFVPLSGGVDSRYIAASLVRLAGDPSLVPTISWGEDPGRPGSDAQVAPLVAAALGVPHAWHERPQVHDPATFAEAIELTSGEGEGAINYPGNHGFHARLVAEHGFTTMFRGDQSFGEQPRLLTDHAVFAASGLARLRLDPGYPRLLDPALVASLADAQDALFRRWRRSLVARTPHAMLYELKLGSTFRREILANNVLKHVHLEVQTPLLERTVLEWVRGLSDLQRSEKRVFRLALARRFPEVAAIPFATANNLPDWQHRARTDPALARFLREWFRRPGWLASIGAEGAVLAAVDRLEATAVGAEERGNGAAGVAADGGGARRRLRQRAISALRATPPGELLREWTMERRAVGDRSMYDRLMRLAVLHGLIGEATARRRVSGEPARPRAMSRPAPCP